MIKKVPESIVYPSISVAIATYNGEKYLEEQLDSILSQTLKPSEIIVCDDQSTDGTREILEKYQQKGLIKYFVNDKRLGFIGNFKRAVSLTSPENYIALSDQDDIWLPSKIQAAAELLLKIEGSNRPAMVYSDLVLVDEDKNLLNKSFRNELGQGGYIHCLETLLFGSFVNGCTMLMNPNMRNYFSSIPEKGTLNHDTWMSLIAYTFGEVAVVPDSLILYRRHSNNATDVGNFHKLGRFSRLWAEVLRSFKKNDLFEDQISFVSEFYTTFQQDLNEEQKNLIQKFLKLKGKSYLEKKIALRMFFRGKWK
jgi:glycosyltransferase involved in cell wall biosynthesis